MAAANVDPSEIAKFEALADRWWDPTSEFKPLHDINPLRCNYIDERAPLAGKVVLDVGCGGGILSEAMAQRGAQVTGIDMGQAPLSVAKLHALESGVTIDYQQKPVEQLAAEQANETAKLDALQQDLAKTGQLRADALAEIDDARGQRSAHRDELVAALDAELVDLYERQRAASGVGAARLQGRRCGGCRIELDRGEIARIAATPEDEVVRCSECRAILLRVGGPGR